MCTPMVLHPQTELTPNLVRYDGLAYEDISIYGTTGSSQIIGLKPICKSTKRVWRSKPIIISRFSMTCHTYKY